MKGLIIVNAYYKQEHYLNQAYRLKEEFDILGVQTQIQTNNNFCTSIVDNSIINNYCDYDFCVYFDKDKYVSAMLEKCGMRLFNRHNANRVCDDKMEAYVELANSGVPLVDTLGGLLCYRQEVKVDKSTAELVAKKLGLPLILKKSFGSLGVGVYKIDSLTELFEKMEEVKMQPHLFQKFISSSAGRDVRVIVVGNKIVASMLRQNDSDFRSNIESGGIGKRFDLPESFKKVCLKVSKQLGLDYCGIDLLFDENDQPIVCEINSNAFFGGIEKVTGVNVARHYAEYIVKEIGERN